MRGELGQHVFQQKKCFFCELGKLKAEEEEKQQLLVRLGEGFGIFECQTLLLGEGSQDNPVPKGYFKFYTIACS